MNENEERAKGKLQEVGGSIKEAAGRAFGNERLETEGRGDKYEGQDRQDVAKGVGQIKGAAEELKGNVKQGIGNLTDDERTRAEGKADELKGEARQDFNR
jgi:uncharacterized protein YjbJ (UPF0337 family)